MENTVIVQAKQNSKRNYYIKGSGTSHCLINNSTQDQIQFIEFDFKHYLNEEDKDKNIKQISMAGLYLMIVLENGRILKLGSFLNHQHICKTFVYLLNPKIHVSQISSGWDHTIFKSTDQQFYGLGSNKYFQLSMSQKIKYLTQPQLIQFSTLQQFNKNRIQKFICGFRQSYFISRQQLHGCVQRYLYGCGQSKKYQLGIKQSKPIQLVLISKLQQKQKVKKLSTAKRSLFILFENNSLYVIGSNQYKIFNHDNRWNQCKECKECKGCEDQCKDKFQDKGKSQNKGLSSNSQQHYQTLTQINTNVCQIQCGWNHIILIKAHKDKLSLQSYGRNNFRQLGRQNINKVLNKNQSINENQNLDKNQKLNQNENKHQQKSIINLELGNNLSNIHLKSGTQFTFCLINSKLYGWGWNQHQNILNSKQQLICFPKQILLNHNNNLLKKCQQISRIWTYPAITIVQTIFY